MAQTDRQIALYSGLSKGEFKVKYRVTKAKAVKIPVLLHKVKRNEDGSFKRCTGSKKCRAKGRIALWVTDKGQLFCKRCAQRYRAQWLKNHGTSQKEIRLQRCKKLKTAGWKERVFAGWKDTPEQAAIRRSPAYQAWRKVVLERDNYTCQHCETTGGRLVVHHIKTFKMNPELRLESDNGIVLCNKCHEELHLSRMKKPRILRLA